MKKIITLTAASVFALAAFQAKADTPQSGIYISGSLGFGFNASNEEFYNNDSALGQAVGLGSNRAAGIERDFNMSPIVRGAVGYNFNNNIRAEVEFSHARSQASFNNATIYDLSAGTSSPAGGPAYAVFDSVNHTALMGNIYYDFETGQKLRPFVMGGLGVAQTSATQKMATALMGAPFDLGQTSTGLAAQIGAGATYALSDTMKLTGEYRLINYGVGAKAGDNGVNMIDHQVTLGLMKYF